MSNVYKEHGYKNRADYFKALAEEYDVDMELVVMLEDLHDE